MKLAIAAAVSAPTPAKKRLMMMMNATTVRLLCVCVWRVLGVCGAACGVDPTEGPQSRGRAWVLGGGWWLGPGARLRRRGRDGTTDDGPEGRRGA
jgi:hypothetical protein